MCCCGWCFALCVQQSAVSCTSRLYSSQNDSAALWNISFMICNHDREIIKDKSTGIVSFLVGCDLCLSLCLDIFLVVFKESCVSHSNQSLWCSTAFAVVYVKDFGYLDDMLKVWLHPNSSQHAFCYSSSNPFTLTTSYATDHIYHQFVSFAHNKSHYFSFSFLLKWWSS